MSASRTCIICEDTHTMTLHSEDYEDREVMCTHCLAPCQKCRAGGNGPYCAVTPCECACHWHPDLTRNVLVPRQSVMNVSDFPMPGWSCNFPGCEYWATLVENAKHHERRTGYAHCMQRVFLVLDKSAAPPVPEKSSDVTLIEAAGVALQNLLTHPTHHAKQQARSVLKKIHRRLGGRPKPEPALPEEILCPKCHFASGNCWSQCGGSCPMPMSPHFKAEEREKWKV